MEEFSCSCLSESQCLSTVISPLAPISHLSPQQQLCRPSPPQATGSYTVCTDATLWNRLLRFSEGRKDPVWGLYYKMLQQRILK